jgi:hypothetical protein
MNIRGILWVTLVGMAWTTAARAEADPPRAPAKTEHAISLLAGYGVGDRFEDDARNRYGLALGARAGLTLPAPRLYFGLSFVHFSGYDEPTQQKGPGIQAERAQRKPPPAKRYCGSKLVRA